MKTIHQARYFFWYVILAFACMLWAGLMTASRAEASSVIFEPKVISVQAGKTFTLPIIINPGPSRQYTARISIDFPSNLIEMTSFAFGPNWLPVPQPGYDSVDNNLGQLVKTGGFPRGFSEPIVFGTVTFLSKSQGESTISLGAQSFVLDARNESTIESRPQVRVIASGAPVPETPSVQSPTIEPLPDLPAPEPNIFDIALAPEPTASGPGITFFISLAAIAVALGIVGRFVFVKLRRRAVMQNMNYDKNL